VSEFFSGQRLVESVFLSITIPYSLKQKHRFLGALLFFIAYSLKIELFYAIMGLLFIIELTSTTLQILSYKLFKKRIFKMAPIHHHFEKCGWSETKVVRCFWAFSFLVSLCGFLLLLL
jgi:phospho-N-acetylmuramoyl-pentapeptide-transferase